MRILPVTILLEVKDGVLIPKRPLDRQLHANFIQKLEEGEILQVTYELVGHDAKYSQLSKLYACIDSLCKFIGYEKIEMKKLIKEQAGLYNPDGSLKSFGNCTKEELIVAIEAAIKIGISVDFPLE